MGAFSLIVVINLLNSYFMVKKMETEELKLGISGDQKFDQSEAEENDDVRIIPQFIEQDWMASLHISFATEKSANIALNSLAPDIEPRVGCYRRLSVDGCVFSGIFSAPDPKGLSISLRGFLDHLSLIEACFKRFLLDAMPIKSQYSHVCKFNLSKNCETFSRCDWDFFAGGKYLIESDNCVNMCELIHEYLKVYVDEIALVSKDKCDN